MWLVMTEFTVILVEPKYDGNIGSVARVMKNFGCRNLPTTNEPSSQPHGCSMALNLK